MFSLNFLFLTSIISLVSAKDERPHIIFILVDDLGWNDVSFHGSSEITTPNIDALASSGIVLQRHYTAPLCTPSRGSLMTGKYPIHLGLQHHVIDAGSPRALPLGVKLLPEHLKHLGYSTQGVGKWHLGYYKKEHTPTYRGFDSFFGYWNAQIDSYDYTSYEVVRNVPELQYIWGIDLHNGTEAIRTVRGRYATDVFTDVAVDIIKRHDISKPLFLYMSHLAGHSGNIYAPQQAPPEYVHKFTHIENLGRRTFAGAVARMDESVGEIFQALHFKGMLKNSIIVFSSDNGGDPEGIRGEKSNNWPLRSVKFHLWEGGVRVPAVIWSPLLKLTEPRISTHLIHISDWLPTLYRAAGGDITDLGNIDGMDMWSHFLKNYPSPRKEILLNIDPILGTSAIIQGNFKLIFGQYPDKKNHWYGTSGKRPMSTKFMDEWVWKDKCLVKDILQETGLWLVRSPDAWRTNLVLDCGNCHDSRLHHCDLAIAPCLYDLEKDPCEYENLSTRFPQVVESLLQRIAKWNATSLAVQFAPVDPRADPRCHGFSYVSWLDDDYRNTCPFHKE